MNGFSVGTVPENALVDGNGVLPAAPKAEGVEEADGAPKPAGAEDG